ncbi:MAG TPA: M48 family metallopeptidase [Pseudomonadales bacterium]|nr:M48 family metallopeptidase [Pseudomonadales bacterium]
MNFFESQDKARRKTGLLVFLLVLAVLCLIGMTQLLVMAVMNYASHSTRVFGSGQFWHGFTWPMLAYITVGITSVVTLASIYKMTQLSAGGSAVAEMLGGELLERSSTEMHERRILNVVEEMAIASGVPVPPVYIIEDASINAFAAGHDRKDVAICITRGLVQLLNRDELQGVIAHEFSHIFNGDMKINLRLIGILHGILFIGLIGRTMLDGTSRTRVSWSSRDNRGTGPLLMLGVGLLVIGYAGTFFGNIIKAAISRQREFLADASAVQYTRNPGGISGALKKIGGYSHGSFITHPNATQVSHLFFANGIYSPSSFFSLFATHPPLEERILAIEPRWDGDFPVIDANSVAVEKTPIDPSQVNIVNGEIQYSPSVGTPAASAAAHMATVVTAGAVATAINAIGAPAAEHMQEARKTLDSIPDELLRLSRESNGACAVVHCLLLDGNDGERQKHFALLEKAVPGGVYAICQKIVGIVDELPIQLRLPLIDLCLPSVKLLGATDANNFMNAVMAQIKADGRVSLFEWALYRLLRQHMENKPAAGGQLKLAALSAACCTVLSALALATHSNPQQIRQQFQNGWDALGLPAADADFSVLDDMARLDTAVRQLGRLQALAKPRLLKACCATICHENTYAPAAVELLRAIADSIDTPIPPIITPSENSPAEPPIAA